MNEELKIGDLVKVTFGEYKDEVAVVYDVYKDYNDYNKLGVCIITQGGDDMGGFGYREQHYLKKIKSTDFDYNFVSVMRLADDYRQGVFAYVFNQL